MHERSLMTSLLRQVEQIRIENHASAVAEVRLEVGILSGVETSLMKTAFDQIAIDPSIASAQLVIDEVPLKGTCCQCNREQPIQKFDFCCQVCGGNISISSGEDVMLVSVTLIDESFEEAMV